MIYGILLYSYDIISGIFPKNLQNIKKINNTFQHKFSLLHGSIIDSLKTFDVVEIHMTSQYSFFRLVQNSPKFFNQSEQALRHHSNRYSMIRESVHCFSDNDNHVTVHSILVYIEYMYTIVE